jgi:selenocysteine lyase/cysteine desulfurase
MKPNEHYLDYTGSSVYCQSQIERVFAELRSHMFGNPHSANPSSSMTGDRVEEVRGRAAWQGGCGRQCLVWRTRGCCCQATAGALASRAASWRARTAPSPPRRPRCLGAWRGTRRALLQVRDLVLRYFNADPAEYQVVFTRSATGALKLVGETFPWSK